MHISIEGQKYQIPESLKLGEIRLIKQISGIRPAEIQEAIEAGDPDLIAALVLVVMRRAGRQIDLAQVDELSIGSIDFGSDEAEDEAGNAEAAKEAAGS